MLDNASWRVSLSAPTAPAMFVRTTPRQLDDDAIEHLLAEVFASVEEPAPIDAELTGAEAQALLDGFELAIERYRRHRSQNRAA